MNLNEAKFASVDLETTGFNPYKDEIIAIGVVPMEGLKILSSKSFYSLVKSKSFDVKGLKIHGISSKDLERAPSFDEISPKVYDLLKESIIVGFCVELDYRFLKSVLKELETKTIDIMKIDRVLSRYIGEKYIVSPDLDSLAKKYELKTPYRHNALADAFISAQIFQLQLLKVLKIGVNTVDKLFNFLNEPEQPII
ncbi:MAG: 3'-5' exonuclease [Archaeoglobaceae archaeon]|nr:3'-5' exonuclease [Archaeoglobaceae archaeon]MDW7989848.1 3'-5' exonuclease [Archaeoglobaceae archaeon]